MSQVKTAISVNKEIFREANLLAKKEHVSRSHLFEIAMAQLVKKRKGEEITAQINRVYEKHPQTTEEKQYQKMMDRYQAKMMKEDKW